jgi:hypothetical protein
MPTHNKIISWIDCRNFFPPAAVPRLTDRYCPALATFVYLSCTMILTIKFRESSLRTMNKKRRCACHGIQLNLRCLHNCQKRSEHFDTCQLRPASCTESCGCTTGCGLAEFFPMTIHVQGAFKLVFSDTSTQSQCTSMEMDGFSGSDGVLHTQTLGN